MKARALIVCVLIGGGFLFFFLRPVPKPNANTPKTRALDAKADSPETNPIVAIKQNQPPPGQANTPDDPLTAAYQMAAFIDQVIASVPQDRFATRSHLKGIQTVFFVSDYVMAAKTNSNMALSKSAIVAAFTNVTNDTTFIRDRLRLWAVRPGTLTDHYQSISGNPQVKDQITAIKTTMTENGVVIDSESDLLMDCIRYAVHNTDIHEMYGANPRRIQDATPFPAELQALVSTGDDAFRRRFTAKFGLDPGTVTNLMKLISGVRIYDLSPADVEIPVERFR